MFVALDKNGKRVEAEEAIKGEIYVCPICGQEVILRDGNINVTHFAHKNECKDTWHYDMSEWHKKMQNFFKKESREVVVESEGVKHRADILEKNIVIEMQHSPITAEEFCERNNFFRKCGYKVVWIFDFREKIENQQIKNLDEDHGEMFLWSNPIKIFKTISDKISDYNNFLNIFFHMDEHNEITAVDKIIWTKQDDNGCVDISRFCIRKDPLIMENVEDIQEYVMPLEEIRKKEFKKAIDSLKEVSKLKGFKFEVKYIGKKGENKDKYICKRRNEFGLKIGSEKGCFYCKHCAMIVEKEEKDKNMFAIYCCYPYEYRKTDKMSHPGYECSDNIPYLKL